MQPHPREGQTVLARVERPYERSPLFEWLMTHHDAMVASSGGRRIEWSRLCADFAKEGLTDADGKPVKPATARMTWWRVRKERARLEALRAAERAERERRAAANPRRDMPSQFRKGDYGPPLATIEDAARQKLPATTVEQTVAPVVTSTVTHAASTVESTASSVTSSVSHEASNVGNSMPAKRSRLKKGSAPHWRCTSPNSQLFPRLSKLRMNLAASMPTRCSRDAAGMPPGF